MYYFSTFVTADGLDLGGEGIHGKGSLQEVETGAVVSVGKFHAEKERIHTPKFCQVLPRQIRSP